MLTAPAGDVNRLTLTLTTLNKSDSDIADASGHVLTRLTGDFDPVARQPTVTGIEFIGGDVSLTDISLKLTFFLIGSITADSSGIGAVPDTPSPPAPVSGGQFSMEHHVLRFNRGLIEVAGTGLFAGLSTTLDLAAEPLDATSPGTGTIVLSLVSSNQYVGTWRASLDMPISFSETVYTNPVATLSGSGRIVAEGTFPHALEPLTVSVAPAASDGVTLAFVTVAGKDYGVQWRDDTGQGTWRSVSGLLPGENGVTTWTDDGTETGSPPSAVPRRFYRVMELP